MLKQSSLATRRRKTGHAAMAWLVLGVLYAVSAAARSPCYEWALFDNSVPWGGWVQDPDIAVRAWVEAHDHGALATALAPVSSICIRNAHAEADSNGNYHLYFEYASWGGGEQGCSPTWNGNNSSFFVRDNQQCKVFIKRALPPDAQLAKSCPAPAPAQPEVADPITPANGNAFKIEPDLQATAGGLHFSRVYNSASSEQSTLGIGWRHSYSARLTVVRQGTEFEPYLPELSSSLYDDEAPACASGFDEIRGDEPTWANASASYADGKCLISRSGQLLAALPILYSARPLPANPQVSRYDATRDDGRVVSFLVIGGAIVNSPGSTLRLEQTSTGFTLTDNDDSIETYDPAGQLLSRRSHAGVVHTLGYDVASRLSTVTDSFGHQISLGYDGNGRLATLNDPANRVVQYSYDLAGRLSTVRNVDSTTRSYLYEDTATPRLLTGLVDEMGHRLSTWSYDSSGRAIGSSEAGGANAVSLTYNTDETVTTTDALGASRIFSFARYGDLKLATGISGSPCPGCELEATTAYDNLGFPTSSTDYNGNVTRFTFNERGLDTSRTEAFGTPSARTITTTWHSTFRLPIQIDEPNRSTSFAYDTNGNLLTRTITDTLIPGNSSRTWTYTYDSYGRVLTEDGPRTDVNDVTTYTYYTCASGGGCGQIHTITDAAGLVTTINTYNAYGDPLTIIDANGVLETRTYDAQRRLSSITVDTETTTIDYWASGLPRRTRAPDGSYLLLTYDAARRLKSVADGEGNRVDYTLDAMGNTTAENVYDPSNALVRTRSRVFDSLSRLWKNVPSVGTPEATTTYTYDENGNLTQASAPLARSTQTAYDELERLKQITDSAGVTQLSYNADDDVASVTDPRGLITTYGYNGFGDQISVISPDAGATTRTFDGAGNVETVTDARGVTATYHYDSLNRVTSVLRPDQSLVFTYDSGTNGAGRLTGVSDAAHSMAWSYDPQGRVTSSTQVVGLVTKTVGYQYQNGNRVAVVTPSGQTVSYSYANGRVSSIAVNNVMVLNDILYDPFGPPRQWTWANGSIAVRTQDQDGKVTQVDAGGDFYEYSYDEAQRVASVSNTTDSSQSWTYGYDSSDRLTSASSTPKSEAWTYDTNGNRLTESGARNGQPFSDTYTLSSTSNRLTSIAGSRTNSYGYDNAGNVTSETNAGRPVGIGTAATVSYRYNALSQRVWKSGPDAPTYFVYDLEGHLLGEYGTGGALIQETVWLGNLPIATLRPRSVGGVDVFYIHADHLGTPRKITRPIDNLVVWQWNPGAFGTELPSENPQGAGTFRYNLRFPGQYYDAESGLNYNYYRLYDPAVGRYTQSDPIGLVGGMNTYSYVSGSPLAGIDPFGLLDYADLEQNYPHPSVYPTTPQTGLTTIWDLIGRRSRRTATMGPFRIPAPYGCLTR